jgi:hypothetical protein
VAFRGLYTEQAPQSIRDFVRQYVDMQFADVHAMLRLPITTDVGLEAGCNFAAVSTLCGLIAGASTLFYRQNGSNGDRFRGVLNDYYPWGQQPSGGVSQETTVGGSVGRLSQSARARMGRVDQRGRTKGEQANHYGCERQAARGRQEKSDRRSHRGPRGAQRSPAGVAHSSRCPECRRRPGRLSTFALLGHTSASRKTVDRSRAHAPNSCILRDAGDSVAQLVSFNPCEPSPVSGNQSWAFDQAEFACWFHTWRDMGTYAPRKPTSSLHTGLAQGYKVRR